MNLRDLQYLVALADHRHFGRAADACFVSQPTLSTQIKKLEKELGVELLERQPRQVLLTAVGAQVVERARVVLDEVEQIEGMARRARDPMSGRVRIGLFPTIAPYLLPHVVPGLHRRFPDLEVFLVEEKTEELFEQLASGRLDVAVVALPLPDDRFDHRELFAEDFVLAVPATHRLADGREPIDPAILAAEPLLLLEDGHCLRDQALEVCELAGARERPGFRATSLETLRHMVASGVGVTLLPRLAVSDPVSQSDDIVLREFDEPIPQRRIVAAWRRTSPFADFYPQLADALADVSDEIVHHPHGRATN